jgi:hypothetical protein
MSDNHTSGMKSARVADIDADDMVSSHGIGYLSGKQNKSKSFTRSYLRPSNFQLMIKFFEFFSVCPFKVDQPLGDLFEKCVRFIFTAEVKGFQQNELMKESILAKVALYLDQTLKNDKLQGDCHTIIHEFLNDTDRPFYKSIISKIQKVTSKK